ncbi:TonB-dependent outer membrane receptor VreA [Paraburkholderia jirisanensis]
MTGRRPSTHILALAAYIMLFALVIRSSQAQDTGRANRTASGAIHFALPAQPLAAALQALGSMTDLSVLAGSNVLDGRVSAPLDGDFSPREALQRLLDGTGLQASFISENSAVLLPAATPPAAAPAPVTAPEGTGLDAAPPIAGAVVAGNDYQSYAAMIQVRLAEALCRSAQTRPGSYRLLLQFHIDARGAVVAPQLLESTGTAARDAAISGALRGLVLDAAPPPALQQPVTILLRPQQDSAAAECSQPDGRGG